MNEELYNEKFKVMNRRIDTLEAEQKEMKKEIRENADLKYTLQNLSAVVNELKDTVNDLNTKDAKTWNNIKWLIISGVVTAMLGFFLGQIFHI